MGNNLIIYVSNVSKTVEQIKIGIESGVGIDFETKHDRSRYVYKVQGLAIYLQWNTGNIVMYDDSNDTSYYIYIRDMDLGDFVVFEQHIPSELVDDQMKITTSKVQGDVVSTNMTGSVEEARDYVVKTIVGVFN